MQILIKKSGENLCNKDGGNHFSKVPVYGTCKFNKHRLRH